MGWPGYDKYVPPGLLRPDGRVQRTGKAKYGNRKTTVDGITFDSAREAKRWTELRMLEKAGQIQQLCRQKRLSLDVNGQHVCDYIADFSYVECVEGGHWMWTLEDSKGFRTKEYILKRKLVKACHGVVIRET